MITLIASTFLIVVWIIGPLVVGVYSTCQEQKQLREMEERFK